MDEMDEGALSTRWSLSLLTHLYHLGVEHIVISPGSRSTPLVLAASSIPGLKKHVIIDERSAAFFALGIGKSTGKPAVLICTSGTAASNYFPAIIEGFQSYSPIIIVSADRPFILQNRHAPQTINQKHLFGDYALLYKDSEELRLKDAYSVDLYLLAKELFYTSVYKRGPVHLNTPFPKPLEPNPELFNKIINETIVPSFSGYKIEKYATESYVNDALHELSEHLKLARKPIIIAGPSTVDKGVESNILNLLFENTNIPILAECTSNIRFPNIGSKKIITRYETYLRSEKYIHKLKPDFIIFIGLPPISIALNKYINKNKDVEQWAFSHARFIPDPDYTLNRFFQLPFFSGKHKLPQFELNNQEWIHQWITLEERANGISMCLNLSDNVLTDGNVTKVLLDSMKDNEILFLSNSLSVRDADLVQLSEAKKVRVYHNRGASGIDGITSTAAGVAIGTGKTTWLLTGDISFLHDTTGLMILSKLEAKLNIILLNNNGGTIFRMLPVYQLKDIYHNYFETPQNVNIRLICEGFGINHHIIKHINELETLLSNNKTNNSVTVFECCTNADSSLQLRNSFWKSFID